MTDEEESVIHYEVKRRRGCITACGYIFTCDSAPHFVISDVESVDCKDCLASDEGQAQLMENALKVAGL